jgi:hypothetical protein
MLQCSTAPYNSVPHDTLLHGGTPPLTCPVWCCEHVWAASGSHEAGLGAAPGPLVEQPLEVEGLARNILRH